MIPYFKLDILTLGPLHIYVWGLMVALGIAAALLVSTGLANHKGLSSTILLDWAAWSIAAAFIGARLGHVFLYDWQNFSAHPFDILKIWQGGLSSFGGFIGAAIASIIYARVKKINFWAYANTIMYGFPLGIGIGRLGCFFNHLHIGKLSNLPWAVAFPGGSRLDMGLIESVFGFILFATYFILERRKPQLNSYLPLTMIIYGATRFLLDFGRAIDISGADARYFGLTPAQFGSILLVIGGIIIWKNFVRINTQNFKN